jgi:hypothetical protein
VFVTSASHDMATKNSSITSCAKHGVDETFFIFSPDEELVAKTYFNTSFR